jgi:hypothetical protein
MDEKVKTPREPYDVSIDFDWILKEIQNRRYPYMWSKNSWNDLKRCLNEIDKDVT